MILSFISLYTTMYKYGIKNSKSIPAKTEIPLWEIPAFAGMGGYY